MCMYVVRGPNSACVSRARALSRIEPREVVRKATVHGGETEKKVDGLLCSHSFHHIPGHI